MLMPVIRSLCCVLGKRICRQQQRPVQAEESARHNVGEELNIAERKVENISG